jgi:hypothetical protein
MNLRVEIEARNLAADRPIEWVAKDLSADTAEPAVNFGTDMRGNHYKEAKRHQESVLAPLERKVRFGQPNVCRVGSIRII